MEKRRYLALFWRWVGLIVLGAAAAGGLAFALSKSATPVYRASSRLLIDEGLGNGGSKEYSLLLLEQRLAQTYIEIINTRPVLEETIELLKLPFLAEELAGMLFVAALPDTQIIVVSVEDTDPARAALIANAVGDVFIAQNRDREKLRYAEPITNWEARLNQLGDGIQRLETEINAFGPARTAEEQATLSRLQTRLNEAQIRYTEAFNNLNALQVAQAKESSNLIQIERAQPPYQPVRPRPATNTILAALAGAMLALAVAFVVEYLDDTVKSPQQFLEDAGLKTFGTIGLIQGSDSSSRLVTAHAPGSSITEAYRVLRTNLSFTAAGGSHRSLLVTSALPGEGKSTTAANLAVVMAQMGRRTAIVDADLRRPIQHQLFQIGNSYGLTTVLEHGMGIEEALQKTPVPGLTLLASGPTPPNPAEVLNASRLDQVLAALGEAFDVVILDTPPALSVADVAILAPRVDGCLLVVEINKTQRPALVQATRQLQASGATLLGAVVNRFRPGRSTYYDYTYGYSTDQSPGSLPARLPAWLAGLSKR